MKGKIHFIAIGGSVMHNLALALHALDYQVTGSDDEIYDPARSRLESKGLLPVAQGWDEERIHDDLECVILGMHAKPDNPELKKAKRLKVPIYSFPEFIFHHSRNKQRVVIAGSHGKTTITSMVMHVLREMGRDFDYLVGAQIEGFETMVRLSDDAPMVILEGDEYLSSPMDPRPKFLVYRPHLALISGIAWDHINVFPTEENYNQQFVHLVKSIPKAGMIIYNEEDKVVKSIIGEYSRKDEHYLHPYKIPEHKIRNGKYEIKLDGQRAVLEVIGKHNLANIAGAWKVCQMLAIELPDFLKHISTFKGAANRLEKIYEDDNNIVFKDFAHSPSKVKATVSAIKELFGRRNIIACLELHTFSSLNKRFLSQYKKTLKNIRKKVIFINEHSLAKKKYPVISRQELIEAFDDAGIEYATTKDDLLSYIRKMRGGKNVFLMMSSGNFANLDLNKLPKE